jgi:hypothetical protein
MVKGVAIGGLPAVGKTTIMKEVRNRFKPFLEFSFGLVRGIRSVGTNIYFIGVFDDSLFEGCDKLSLAVQPELIKWCDLLPEDSTVVFEGDRLFSLETIKKTNAHVIIVTAMKSIIDGRHIGRMDSQTAKFIKGRDTKINNIKNSVTYDWVSNNTPFELGFCIDFITKAINNPIPHKERVSSIDNLFGL